MLPSAFAALAAPGIITRSTAALQSRNLGNEVAGPKTNLQLSKHFAYAKSLVRGDDVLSYEAFKQRCRSFRVVSFCAISAALAADLVLRPPRSSYWRSFSPTNLPKRIFSEFFTASEAKGVFRTSPLPEGQTGWDAFQTTVAKKNKAKK